MLNVSLPDDMHVLIQSEVASGRYADSGHFVRELIGAYRRRRDELFDLLIEAEAGGDSDQTFDEVVEDARKAFASRAV